MIDKEFKYAIFCYEDQKLPSAWRMLDRIQQQFEDSEFSEFTLFQTAHSMDESVEMIDSFKARTCGSAYTISLINLNQFPGTRFLELLLSERGLSNPWTIFQATLRSIDGPLYTLARDKVEREGGDPHSEGKGWTPSCIDSYTPNNLEDAADRVCEILCARLEELETRANLRKTGKLPSISPTERVLRKSSTTFFGSSFASRSGRFRRASGRIPSEGSGRKKSSETITRTYPGPQGLADSDSQ